MTLALLLLLYRGILLPLAENLLAGTYSHCILHVCWCTVFARFGKKSYTAPPISQEMFPSADDFLL